MGDAPTAEILSIGSELLAGETVDTNAAFLAGELTRLGFVVTGVRQLPDDLDAIRDAFTGARSRSALTVSTGGLGPTHDDLSREALAAALGEELRLDPRLEADLRARFAAYGRMPDANLKQAMLIASAEPVANPVGSAPGWWVERDGAVTLLLPGVPSEMRRMWLQELRERVRHRFAPSEPHQRVVRAFGIGESAVAEKLGALLTDLPRGVTAGIYARDDGIHVRYTTASDPAAVDRLATEACRTLGNDAYGTDDADLAAVALSALARRGARSVSTRESGTAGALAAMLAEARPAEGDPLPQFVGGLVLAAASTTSGTPPGPAADVTLSVVLDEQDGHGRSRLAVAVQGVATVASRDVRIHGSGPQRLRRAAYAALNVVRRELADERDA